MSSSLTLVKSHSNHLQKTVYEAPQQVQYLYLEAEIDILLRQLQAVKASQH